jgi:hypothetical protein
MTLSQHHHINGQMTPAVLHLCHPDTKGPGRTRSDVIVLLASQAYPAQPQAGKLVCHFMSSIMTTVARITSSRPEVPQRPSLFPSAAEETSPRWQ